MKNIQNEFFRYMGTVPDYGLKGVGGEQMLKLQRTTVKSTGFKLSKVERKYMKCHFSYRNIQSRKNVA